MGVVIKPVSYRWVGCTDLDACEGLEYGFTYAHNASNSLLTWLDSGLYFLIEWFPPCEGFSD